MVGCRSFVGLVACAVWAAGCGGDDAEVMVVDSEESGASSADAPAGDPDSWRWQGEIVEREDRGALACIDEVDPSRILACSGWPLPDIDWSRVPGAVEEGTLRRATVQLVLSEGSGALVVEDEPVPAVDDWVLPECEVVDAAAGELTLTTGGGVSLLVRRDDALAAGVFAGQVTQFGGGPVERPDVSIDLLLPSEHAIDWLVENLLGLTLEICPLSIPS